MKWNQEGRTVADKLVRAQGVVARVVAALPLMIVVVAPAAASWLGLMAVGRDWLGLGGPWAVLVPLVFDAAALYVAALSWRSVLAGDSALVDRLLVWVYAIGSAGLNVWHAASAPAALFFGAASVSAVVLWDRTLRARRRDALREMGAIEVPLPRYRLLRWVVAPKETAAAFRVAIVEGVTSPTEALALARTASLPRAQAAAELQPGVAGYGEAPSYSWRLLASAADLEAERQAAAGLVAAERVQLEAAVKDVPPAAQDVQDVPEGQEDVQDVPEDQDNDDVAGASAEVGEDAARIEADRVELAGCESKRESLLLAWRRMGVEGVPTTAEVMPAVEWLAERGVRVDKSGAYDLRRRLVRKAESARPVLTAVGGAR